MEPKVSRAGEYIAIGSAGFTGTFDVSGDQVVKKISAYDNGFAAVDLSNCAALTYADFNTGTIAAIDLTGCPALVEVYLNLCALTESAVDAVLSALDANGASNGTVDLSGGTNAPPSAAGLASKASLEGKGWTVTVNS